MKVLEKIIANAMIIFKKIEISCRIILKHVSEVEMLISSKNLKGGSEVNNKDSSTRTFAKKLA